MAARRASSACRTMRKTLWASEAAPVQTWSAADGQMDDSNALHSSGVAAFAVMPCHDGMPC